MGILSAIIYNLKNMKKAKKFRNMGKNGLLAFEENDFFEAINCICEDAVYDITDNNIPLEQKFVYSLNRFEMEVNNGGLCQFFVNSSSECAPYISDALEAIGANELKNLFDNFIETNNINVHDLYDFKIDSIDEYQAQTERYDFDSFDDEFYNYENLDKQIIDYSRKNIDKLILE